jgi:polyisoprenoid-binding protein YceI
MATLRHITGALCGSLLLTSVMAVAAGTPQPIPLPLDNSDGHPVISAMLKASRVGRFYTILPATSEVGFSIDSTLQPVQGRFTHFKGGFAIEPGNTNNGHAVFVVKSDSVATPSDLLDKVIKSEAFMDTAHFPDILFVSSGFTWVNDTSGILKGSLTLRGVTRAVAFDVRLSGLQGERINGNDRIMVKVSTAISRASFGMITMRSLVSDTVSLDMTIQAHKRTGISRKQLAAMTTYAGD